MTGWLFLITNLCNDYRLVIPNNQLVKYREITTGWLFEITNLRSVACWLPARWLFHVGYQPYNQRAAPQITNMRGPFGVLFEYTIGNTFLSQFYVIFDRANSQVGLFTPSQQGRQAKCGCVHGKRLGVNCACDPGFVGASCTLKGSTEDSSGSRIVWYVVIISAVVVLVLLGIGLVAWRLNCGGSKKLSMDASATKAASSVAHVPPVSAPVPSLQRPTRDADVTLRC